MKLKCFCTNLSSIQNEVSIDFFNREFMRFLITFM